MFRPKLFSGILCNLKIQRSYLTSSFYDVINKRLEFPDLKCGNQQFLWTTKRPTSLSLDYMMNRLVENEDRHVDIRDLLLQLRLTNQGSTVLESTSHLIIKHFVDTGKTDELLSILMDQKNYGIFLNSITACFLMDHLLNEKHFEEAAQTAVVSIIFEELDNDLVHALALKSCYGFLKANANEPVTTSTSSADINLKNKVIEKKVRVNYLRNSNDYLLNINNIMPLIGKALIKIDKSSNDISFNIKVIGHLLCNQYNETVKEVMAEPHLIHRDIANLCLSLINDKNDLPTQFVNILRSQTESHLERESFDDKLTSLIKNAVQSQENILIKKQETALNKWTVDRRENMSTELRDKAKSLQMNKIENILTELIKKKQQLWYFSSEDRIELEIFHKRKTYPKRWFGKKKNPKAVDDFYIPPEI